MCLFCSWLNSIPLEVGAQVTANVELKSRLELWGPTAMRAFLPQKLELSSNPLVLGVLLKCRCPLFLWFGLNSILLVVVAPVTTYMAMSRRLELLGPSAVLLPESAAGL